MNLLMDNLSENLKSKLDDNIYSRNSKDDVINAIKELGVYPSKEFIQFYSTYSGPFFEETLGLELMDIVEDKNNIFTSTIICRDKFEFDKKYLILTEISANEVIVLNSETDKVYRVNFEGSEEKLKNGKLQETWKNFSGFLKEYFDC